MSLFLRLWRGENCKGGCAHLQKSEAASGGQGR